jgi:hypothetical protein
MASAGTPGSTPDIPKRKSETDHQVVVFGAACPGSEEENILSSSSSWRRSSACLIAEAIFSRLGLGLQGDDQATYHALFRHLVRPPRADGLGPPIMVMRTGSSPALCSMSVTARPAAGLIVPSPCSLGSAGTA